MSAKGLTKDLINEYTVLNGAKYSYVVILQNYFVFISPKNTLNILVALLEFIGGNLMEYQKKVLKIQLICSNFC